MDKVELRPAYAWDCDCCGLENFCNGIVLPDEAMPDILDEPHLEVDWMQIPETVQCVHCGAPFETQHYHEDDDEI